VYGYDSAESYIWPDTEVEFIGDPDVPHNLFAAFVVTLIPLFF